MGLDATLQAEPFQCSISAVGDPEKLPLPTAQASFGPSAVTALRLVS